MVLKKTQDKARMTKEKMQCQQTRLRKKRMILKKPERSRKASLLTKRTMERERVMEETMITMNNANTVGRESESIDAVRWAQFCANFATVS
jgi:hypothetical protein